MKVVFVGPVETARSRSGRGICHRLGLDRVDPDWNGMTPIPDNTMAVISTNSFHANFDAMPPVDLVILTNDKGHLRTIGGKERAA